MLEMFSFSFSAKERANCRSEGGGEARPMRRRMHIAATAVHTWLARSRRSNGTTYLHSGAAICMCICVFNCSIDAQRSRSNIRFLLRCVCDRLAMCSMDSLECQQTLPRRRMRCRHRRSCHKAHSKQTLALTHTHNTHIQHTAGPARTQTAWFLSHNQLGPKHFLFKIQFGFGRNMRTFKLSVGWKTCNEEDWFFGGTKHTKVFHIAHTHFDWLIPTVLYRNLIWILLSSLLRVYSLLLFTVDFEFDCKVNYVRSIKLSSDPGSFIFASDISFIRTIRFLLDEVRRLSMSFLTIARHRFCNGFLFFTSLSAFIQEYSSDNKHYFPFIRSSVSSLIDTLTADRKWSVSNCPQSINWLLSTGSDHIPCGKLGPVGHQNCISLLLACIRAAKQNEQKKQQKKQKQEKRKKILCLQNDRCACARSPAKRIHFHR